MTDAMVEPDLFFASQVRREGRREGESERVDERLPHVFLYL